MSRTMRRIAVVNRGEAALRAIRAVQDLRAAGDEGLVAIALHTEAERRGLFVREADEAWDLGSASFTDPADGQRKNRYLDYAALERALVETRADAAWVGWGFVSEHARFADLCERLGVVFIGPEGDTIRRLGDKIGSKRLAEEADVPVAPWSGGPVEDLDQAREQAERLGYPLMVKATAGGGGRGIRRVRGPEELRSAFESARSEALKGFGDATVFMERLVEGARHVEVQILGDGRGTTWALGVRDCTIQRRNQKVLEETPSAALTAEQQRELCDAARRLGDLAGYRGAGTVEFLYDTASGRFSFMEVNARLQVEHPVTEETTGVDLVKRQIAVARGERLEGPEPLQRGHAIEVRVCAEDPERGFAPAPGRIDLLQAPGGPGLRIDAGCVEGDRVPPEFDSMIAKVVAHGADRAEALGRLRRALREMRLVVGGGASNKGFLLALLDRPEVESGEVDVGWLDHLSARGEHLPTAHADVALVAGAIEAYEAELEVERAHFFATAARGRPRVRDEIGRRVELQHRGQGYALRVRRVGARDYALETDGATLEARMERVGRYERRLLLAGREHRVLAVGESLEQLVEVDGVPHRVSRDAAGIVRSPSPAMVLSLAVSVGDEVRAGERLVVLEAMKTELAITAPCDGRVREVVAAENTQVDVGAPLVVLEPPAEEGAASEGERVRFDGLAAREPQEAGRERCRRQLERLRHLVLGFDVAPDEHRRLDAERRTLCAELPADDPALLEGEDGILQAFTELCALFRRRGGDVGLGASGEPGAEEYLYLFLRSPDAAETKLPASFLDRLQRALAHYEVASLERTPELQESLLWICKAHARMAEQVGVVLSILERRLERAEALGERLRSQEHRELLDRIVGATRGRYQAVSDLARELRYRVFDRPFFEDIRQQVLDRARADLERAATTGDPAEREAAVQSLVECPQPLVNILTARLPQADPARRALVLEILLRRYFRIRALGPVASEAAGEHGAVRAAYDHQGRRYHVVATCAAWDGLERAADALHPLLERLPSDDEVIVDFFLWRDGPHASAEETETALRERLEHAKLPRRVHRVDTVVAAPGYGPGMSSMQHFTHIGVNGGFLEDRPFRGLHAMMAKRLQLWRTAHFEVERLPSSEDLYLYHGVARENPKDERLFAFAEVRDVTPVRDAHGRVVRLPQLEMMLMEAAAGIRRVQSRRSDRDRLQWNRILLYVWPPLRLSAEELSELAHRLAPATEGLDIEKVVMRARLPDPETGALRERILQARSPGSRGVVVGFHEPAQDPIRPLSEFGRQVGRLRRRGLFHPWELIERITPARDGADTGFPPGEFEEHDLDDTGRLLPVSREPGGNTANLVVGLIRNFTAKHPEGMERVLLVSDAGRGMGSFAEPECRRIIAALDLAEERGIPVDWVPISAGAKIAMDSGTENLDWTALALRRIVEFTQAGGAVNVLVCGINVGGQSYWNAEATMIMHTRGILVMTPGASMVLTGKRALDYSGGVSAEDDTGIGGFDRVMGVNGEAQYWARDVDEACRILLRHYEHSYVAPGERFPRRAPTGDPSDRDICSFPHGRDGGAGFDFVGEIFSDETNPGRRKPFDIRRVMRATVDQDHEPLERWRDMAEAENAVVWDAHLGGIPICLLGFESKPVPRLGFVPIDGPDQWTPGTLFPLSSKKVARALWTASGNRPVVILANLSGFDGSPESLRRLQLEYGAEIGRAIVNFRGPIVFCVISRYHGGAYVVFSKRLNESLEAAALEGSYASVIGGAPAAAVVFSRDVDAATRSDPRLQALEAEIAAADDGERGRLRARWHALFPEVRSEKLREVAARFEKVHSVERAREVGSLDALLPPGRLRPYLIEALERGMERELGGWKRGARP